MNKKLVKKTGMIGYALLLCLCVSLLCSAACAEAPVDLLNTPTHENFLGFCTLPDGGLVLAGYSGTADDPDEGTFPDELSVSRLLCLNPDRTVRWVYSGPPSIGFGNVAVTKDDTIAAYYFDGVMFFTPDGEPTGKKLSLPYTSGNMYDITPFGVLRAKREGDEPAKNLELTDWDGNVLFRLDEPESMWVGTPPLADEDGLVLLGQEAGDPKQAAAKIMKVDLQGNTVWETRLPFLSEDRDYTGAGYGVKTSDGGYLAILWDMKYNPEDDSYNSGHALVKLDANGQLLWIKQPASSLWDLVEYDGKYVAYSLQQDPETGTDMVRYLWLDNDGNELGTTELRIREEYIPPYVSPDWSAVSGEKLFPMDDGLWQMISFLEPDDPKDPAPAWETQDNLLVRVPELGAGGQ